MLGPGIIYSCLVLPVLLIDIFTLTKNATSHSSNLLIKMKILVLYCWKISLRKFLRSHVHITSAWLSVAVGRCERYGTIWTLMFGEPTSKVTPLLLRAHKVI